jgi:hypothetical protein
MASNLSSIGFVFENADAFHTLMLALAEQSRVRLACPEGEYAIWRSRTGAEIWFQLSRGDGNDGPATIIGLAPFYDGASSVPVRMTDVLTRPDDTPLEGLVQGWVAPDETGEGAYPLAFDLVDFGAHKARVLPATWTCRITGFCRTLTWHRDASTLPEIAAGQAMAPQALIPIGLFNDIGGEAGEGAAAHQPEPMAWLSGIVRSHRRFENEVTGRPFHWLSVETLAATVDLVADPDIVTGEIAEGAIVEAMAWMFARVVD